MPPSGKKLALLLVLLCLAGAASAIFYKRYFSAPDTGPETSQQASGEIIDFARPAMLIRSSSLAKLPRDLLRLPVARDLLTEDFVDYYEHHDGKLALGGTLRRIAYENKLQLPDRLIEMALDSPAEVALWSDGRGRLRHFAVAMQQNALARAITMILPLHSKVTASKAWPGIQATALNISYGNEHLSLLMRGDRVVVLSGGLQNAKAAADNPEEQQVNVGSSEETEEESADTSAETKEETASTVAEAQKNTADTPAASQKETADTAAGPQQEIADIVNKLLAENAGQPSIFAQSFHLSGNLPAKGHEVIIAAQTLALGYEHFTPGLAAFRFVFDDAGAWQSAVLLNGAAAAAAYAPLWRALPHGAAFCAAVPVDWTALGAAAADWRQESGDSDKQQLGNLLIKFGPAAVCWYGDSHLYTPLFATASETNLTASEKATLLHLSQAATKIKQPDKPTSGSDSGMWQGSVPSAYGIPTEQGEQAGKRFLHPAAAVSAFTASQKEATDVAFFSPDATLVTKALEVAAKKFPALADSAAFAAGDQIIALISPANLASLMRGEIFQAAPEEQAENFRGVADFLFTPRLDALATYAPQVVSFQAEKGLFAHAAHGWQWYPLRWTSLAASHEAGAKAGNASTTTEATPEAIRP